MNILIWWKEYFAWCPPSENYRLFIIKVGAKLCSYSKETKLLFTKLEELGTTCANSSITILSMDPKLLFNYNKVFNYICQLYAMKEKSRFLVATRD
jgi:hypothetical protein